jgi:uncharacterized membrane protein YciS (DUF1049 family)
VKTRTREILLEITSSLLSVGITLGLLGYLILPPAYLVVDLWVKGQSFGIMSLIGSFAFGMGIATTYIFLYSLLLKLIKPKSRLEKKMERIEDELIEQIRLEDKLEGSPRFDLIADNIKILKIHKKM